MTLAIELRDVSDDDYAIFFEHQRDAAAARMAAFGTQDGSAGDFARRMKKSIASGTTTAFKTIVLRGRVVGMVATFLHEGRPQVTYRVARACWGRGIATEALTRLLATVSVRPIYASAAKDNVASLRVLEKCGFTIRGASRAFASARGEEVEEIFLELR